MMTPDMQAEYDFAMEQAQKAKEAGEAALAGFLKTVFALSPRIDTVTVGSTVDEERGRWFPFVKVAMDGGSVTYPEGLPEEGEDVEVDAVAGALDGLDMQVIAPEFGYSMPVDDEKTFDRSVA
jgi:hypothetical protein